MATGRIRTRWERLDERFAPVGGDRYVEVLFEDGRWLEGPAYSPLWRSVLFSDIPNDRVMRWDETDLYFRVADNAAELPHLRHGVLKPIPSLWGHRAGNPVANPADADFIRVAVQEFLEG